MIFYAHIFISRCNLFIGCITSYEKIWMKKTKLTITMLCVAWLKPQLGLKVGKNDNYECIFERSFPFGHPTRIKNINHEWMIDKLAIINIFNDCKHQDFILYISAVFIKMNYTYLQMIVESNFMQNTTLFIF